MTDKELDQLLPQPTTERNGQKKSVLPNGQELWVYAHYFRGYATAEDGTLDPNGQWDGLFAVYVHTGWEGETETRCSARYLTRNEFRSFIRFVLTLGFVKEPLRPGEWTE